MARAAESQQAARCIHLAGADGTGKTTQGRTLLAWLQGAGVDVRYVWLRFPRLFTVPLLAFARLRGYSTQEVVEGSRNGYWHFERSWAMRVLFPWALLLDTLLIALAKLYVPLLRGQTVLCDRFVVDILVDLMVGVKDPHLDERLPGRLFLALLPRGTRIAVLDLDTAERVRRSPELAHDRSQEMRRQYYREFALRRGWPLISAAAPVEEVTASLIAAVTTPFEAQVKMEDSMAETKGHYAKQGSPVLARLVGNPAGAIAAHWAFQGLLHMDKTERAFKIGLDVVLTAIFGHLLKRLLPVRAALALGWVIAHTLNFLFNGQIYGVLKHFGGVRRTWEEFNAEVDAFSRRVEHEPAIVYAAAYGSLARDQWKPTSDLDVRLVRAPGLRNAWRASWFAVNERTRALFGRFPLDLLVLDSCEALERMAEKEPVVLGENGAVRGR